jgi:hypothetical protein
VAGRPADAVLLRDLGPIDPRVRHGFLLRLGSGRS